MCIILFDAVMWSVIIILLLQNFNKSKHQLQACRGDKLDPGVKLKQGKERRTETDSVQAAYKIPTQADFLIAYSSVEGT